MSDSESDRTQQPARFGEIPVLLFIRGIALLLVMSGIVVAAHAYIGLRLIRDAGWSPGTASDSEICVPAAPCADDECGRLMPNCA